MKSLIFAVLLVIAGAYASPLQEINAVGLPQYEIEAQQSRITISQVRRAINKLRESIKDAGLDPLVVGQKDITILQVLNLIKIRGFLDSLEITGASNIVINRLYFVVLLNRLEFDIVIPEIRLTISDSGIDGEILGEEYTGRLSGSVSIQQLRTRGTVTVRAGVITGVNIRRVSVNFSIGRVTSDLTVVASETDYSNEVNTKVSERISQLITANTDVINQRIEELIWTNWS